MNKLGWGIYFMLTFAAAAVFQNAANAETKYLKGSKQEITKTMMEWNKALGVKCTFCHTKDFSQTYKSLAGKTASAEDLTALVHHRIATNMLGTILYLNQKEGKKLHL